MGTGNISKRVTKVTRDISGGAKIKPKRSIPGRRIKKK